MERTREVIQEEINNYRRKEAKMFKPGLILTILFGVLVALSIVCVVVFASFFAVACVSAGFNQATISDFTSVPSDVLAFLLLLIASYVLVIISVIGLCVGIPLLIVSKAVFGTKASRREEELKKLQ